MARIRLAEAAREDLRDIRAYSKAAHGSSVAYDYLMGLRSAFDLLSERPLAGVREDDLAADTRSFAHRSHRVYYRHDAQGVVIIRVLHHAQDRRGAFGQTQ